MARRAAAYHHQFLGERRWARRCGGFDVVETVYAAGAACDTHAHSDPYLCVVLAGSLENRGRRLTERVGPGEAFFRPSGAPHAVAYGAAGARCLMVRLGPVYMQDVLHAEEQPLSLTSRARAALDGRALSAGRFQALLDGWIEALATADDPPGAPLRPEEAARRHIDAWPVDAPLQVCLLARRVGVHASHLARAFRRRWGRTMSAYAIELRVGRAARELTSGGRIADVAAAAGFYDQSHMTRSFQRVLGTTPRGFVDRWRRARPMQDG